MVGVAVDYAAVAVVDPAGQGDGRTAPARRGHRHPGDTTGRRRRGPRVEPVQVHTRDEVADVADALNIVQDTALDLAVEQAVLRRNIADSFVNLGRRNQNLLGRQLDFITELETNETDPDTLANLFRLDHLATRMRRNAESLLVLAGIEPPRKWAAPVRLTDVIRAALGEVEDYQRVTVRGVEPTTILGSAAADLAHLLAELIENALVFSPPDQTVDIRGRNRPDGYTLAIIDSGLGMPPADVTSANRRLAGAESFTIAPSKYLGHYVAGNLAARHNITVHLDNSPGNGITATIDLPPTLLTTDEAPPQIEEHHAARPVWPPTPIEAAPYPEPPPALRPAYNAGQLPGPSGQRPAPAGPSPAPAPSAEPPGPGGAGGIGRPLAYPKAQFAGLPPAAAAVGELSGPAGPEPLRGATPLPLSAPQTGELPGIPDWYSDRPATPPDAPPARGPAPTPAQDPGEARRTPSGLVKRTPRVVEGTQPQTTTTPGPSDDLLASLSRYTAGRSLAGATGPAALSPQAPTPGAPPLQARTPGNAGDADRPPLAARGPAPTSTGPTGTGDPYPADRPPLAARGPAPTSPGPTGTGDPYPADRPPLAARGPAPTSPGPTGTGDPYPADRPPLAARGPAPTSPGPTGTGDPYPADRPPLAARGPAPTSPGPTGTGDPYPADRPPLAARGATGTGPTSPGPSGTGDPYPADRPPLAARGATGTGPAALDGPASGDRPPLASRGPVGGPTGDRYTTGGQPIAARGPAPASGSTGPGTGPAGGNGRPPLASRTPGPLPTRGPAPAPRHDAGPPAPSRSALGGLAAGLGGAPLGPAPAPAAPAGGGDGPMTAGGLTRRVRGAQMPTTTPHQMRRTGPQPGAPSGARGPQHQPPPGVRGSQPSPSADAVYSFLTSFSAGVQRGLDESRRSGNGH